MSREPSVKKNEVQVGVIDQLKCIVHVLKVVYKFLNHVILEYHGSYFDVCQKKRKRNL